jgi:putative nucleotidyltransferase with HDIG domain
MTDSLSDRDRTKVLFVDDDDLIIQTFKRTMRTSEMEVTTASSVGEALALLERESFGVVLSDYHMPGKNGIELLEEIKERHPDTERILVSGKGDFDVAIEVINRVGLFQFIIKPWDPVELFATVSRAADHYKLTTHNQLLTTQLAEKVSELGELNTSLEREVYSRTSAFLFGLINALDLRDTETQSHSRRVALYAARLAQELGLQGDDLLATERGSLLHDIGKIGVSDTILLKPGKLTEEEWEEMRRHSEYGYNIIKPIEFLGNARRIVWEHHERWDGNGYPHGRGGNDIYIGARIFAVIDTYDAMTSDRPYRKALPHEVAIEEIVKNSGSQFDPAVTDAWLTVSQAEILEIRKRAETFFDRL